MRKNRGGMEANSLELLLDTMCNTFGSILFVGMLLSVLCQNTSETIVKASQSSENKLKESWEDRNKLKNKLLDLEVSLKMLQQAEKQQLALLKLMQGNEDVPLRKRWAELKIESELIKKECESIRESLSEYSQNKSNLITRQNTLKNDIRKLQEEQKEISQKVKINKSKNVRKARLPKIRNTKKAPLFCILKNNRLYICERFRSDGKPYSDIDFFDITNYNNADLEVEKIANNMIFSPKINKGQTLNTNSSKQGMLKNLLSAIRSSEYFVLIAVYPDSFQNFFILRNILVNNNIEYSWSPFEKDQKMKIFLGNVQHHVQ